MGSNKFVDMATDHGATIDEANAMEKERTTFTLSGIWTEQPGIQLNVERNKRGAELVVVDAAHDFAELARYTLSLESRRTGIAEALLPSRDRIALKVGRLILEARAALEEGK